MTVILTSYGKKYVVISKPSPDLWHVQPYNQNKSGWVEGGLTTVNPENIVKTWEFKD